MRPLPWKTLTIFSQFLAMHRLFAGKNDHPFVILEALEEHFDFIADLERVGVVEFVDIDDALGLVANVDEDFARAHFENAALDDGLPLCNRASTSRAVLASKS